MDHVSVVVDDLPAAVDSIRCLAIFLVCNPPMREELVNWLRERVRPDWWDRMWWIAPAMTLLLLPVGVPLLRLSGMIGWDGAPRATQGLMVFALTSGVVIGLVVLWSASAAHLSPIYLRRAQWLARLAVLGPLLTLLVMFWIAKAT